MEELFETIPKYLSINIACQLIGSLDSVDTRQTYMMRENSFKFQLTKQSARKQNKQST